MADGSDDDRNPLFALNEATEDGAGVNRFAKLFSAFLTRAPPPPSAPAVVFAPPSPPPPPPPAKTKGWSCYAMLIAIVVTTVVVLTGALIWVGVDSSRSATVESLSNEVVSLGTRYARLQQHYPIVAYLDMYGDEPGATELRTETASLKSLARIAGSVDLNRLRFDWNLRVTDAHGLLGARMTIAFWVQSYDAGTHLMRHVVHSPLVLCANITTNTTCAGHVDKPSVDLGAADELDPRVLSLALYDVRHVAHVNQTSVPLWIVPL